MAEARKVGDLYVDISGKTGKLDADLKTAEAAVAQSSAKMEQAATGVNAQLKETGAKIKESTSGIRGITSAITGIVGMVSRWLGLLGLIVVAFQAIKKLSSSVTADIRIAGDNQQRAAAYISSTASSLNKASTQQAIVNAHQKALAPLLERELELRAKIDRLRGGGNTGLATIRAEQELAQLVAVRVAINAQAVRASERAGAEAGRAWVYGYLQAHADSVGAAAAKAQKTLDDARQKAAEESHGRLQDLFREERRIVDDALSDSERATRDSLTEEERIRYDAQKRIDALRKAAEVAWPDERARILEAITLIERQRDAELRRLRDVAAEATTTKAALSSLTSSSIGPVGDVRILRDIYREIRGIGRKTARRSV